MVDSQLLIEELPYRAAADYFTAVAYEPWSQWLDSGHPEAEGGRYDIVVARPRTTLYCDHNGCRINGGELLQDEPLHLVKQLLPRHRKVTPPAGVPFVNGALGLFGYDLARDIGLLPQRDDETLPHLVLGFYDWALVVDHRQRQCRLVGDGAQSDLRQQWPQLVELFSSTGSSVPAPFTVNGGVASNMDRNAYADGFKRIQHYLREGDCYQVNFAQRFSTQVAGDPWRAYLSLREHNPAPFGAYLNLPGLQVLSSSPERFLRLDAEGAVETKPIKGTRRREGDSGRDAQVIEELVGSEKDRAENLMIVDLLRNDLGKVCRPGSVQVEKLFAIESFATVHHMVSTVRGELAEGEDGLSLLRGAFPGGSITGAPKRRAMEIINELEPDPRGIYCGAIGYLGSDGAMDTNIAIRTVTHRDGELAFHAGGGIVIDSQLEAEYQESLDKAAAFFRWLGTAP